MNVPKVFLGVLLRVVSARDSPVNVVFERQLIVLSVDSVAVSCPV